MYQNTQITTAINFSNNFSIIPVAVYFFLSIFLYIFEALYFRFLHFKKNNFSI